MTIKFRFIKFEAEPEDLNELIKIFIKYVDAESRNNEKVKK